MAYNNNVDNFNNNPNGQNLKFNQRGVPFMNESQGLRGLSNYRQPFQRHSNQNIPHSNNFDGSRDSPQRYPSTNVSNANVVDPSRNFMQQRFPPFPAPNAHNRPERPPNLPRSTGPFGQPPLQYPSQTRPFYQPQNDCSRPPRPSCPPLPLPPPQNMPPNSDAYSNNHTFIPVSNPQLASQNLSFPPPPTPFIPSPNMRNTSDIKLPFLNPPPFMQQSGNQFNFDVNADNSVKCEQPSLRVASQLPDFVISNSHENKWMQRWSSKVENRLKWKRKRKENENPLKICDAQKKLLEYVTLVKQLEDLVASASTDKCDNDQWQEFHKETQHLKRKIMDIRDFLSPETIESLKELILKRRKKRIRSRRTKNEKKRLEKKRKEEWKEKERRIDEQLRKIHKKEKAQIEIRVGSLSFIRSQPIKFVHPCELGSAINLTQIGLEIS